jgi:MFS family permease
MRTVQDLTTSKDFPVDSFANANNFSRDLFVKANKMPPEATPEKQPSSRLVIVASSLGTLFEWYDFFLYGALTAVLSTLFFPSDSPTAGLLLVLATFGAGFAVRPLGAVLFGVLGDRIGRKYTFLATLTLMGVSTALVGVLPTYANAGIWAPILLVSLRLLQGLALGGEYGGAAVYVAEHAPPGKRGFYTSWIQASVVGGFVLSLAVVLAVRLSMSPEQFLHWGWRVPFLLSILMLAISLYVRLKLRESPVFQAMKAKGETAKAPLRESFASWQQTRTILAAMMGIAAGFTVIWYTAQFSTLAFLKQVALVDELSATIVNGIAVTCAVPFFILFGALSDRIGRKKVMLTGYALTLLLLFGLFKQIGVAANPELTQAMARAPVSISGRACEFDVFATTQATPCAQALAFLTKRGIAYEKSTSTNADVTLNVGAISVNEFSAAAYTQALADAGYPTASEPATRSLWRAGLCIFALCVLSAMTYAPVAAYMVELFPARVRYTSMSIPYHVGTGYFGGFLPLVSQYMVVKSGDPFAGLYYTLSVVAIAFVTCWLFLPETYQRDIA